MHGTAMLRIRVAAYLASTTGWRFSGPILPRIIWTFNTERLRPLSHSPRRALPIRARRRRAGPRACKSTRRGLSPTRERLAEAAAAAVAAYRLLRRLRETGL